MATLEQVGEGLANVNKRASAGMTVLTQAGMVGLYGEAYAGDPRYADPGSSNMAEQVVAMMLAPASVVDGNGILWIRQTNVNRLTDWFEAKPKDATPTGGIIRFADARPQGAGAVGGFVYQDAGKHVLNEIRVTETDDIELYVISAMPQVEFGGVRYDLTKQPDGFFGGWLPHTLTSNSEAIQVYAVDGDGNAEKFDTLAATKATKPVISDVSFVLPTAEIYPIWQDGDGKQRVTELRAGLTVEIEVTADQPIYELEVLAGGAFVPDTVSPLSRPGHTMRITGTIRDAGVVPQELGAIVRVKNQYNSWSKQARSKEALTLNNVAPTLVISNTIYPLGQQALKDSEQALLILNSTDVSFVEPTSPTGELKIEMSGDDEYEATRIAGDYNVTENNTRFRASSMRNGREVVVEGIVNIAHAAAAASLNLPAARLTSTHDATGKTHTIGFSANQLLLSPPSMQLPGFVPQLSDFGGGGTKFSATIIVDNTDPKGNFNVGSVNFINLAGIVSTKVSNPEIVFGGVEPFDLVIAPYNTGPYNVDVEFVDHTKIRASHFSYNAEKATHHQFGTYDEAKSYDAGFSVTTGGKPASIRILDLEDFAGNPVPNTLLVGIQELP